MLLKLPKNAPACNTDETVDEILSDLVTFVFPFCITPKYVRKYVEFTIAPLGGMFSWQEQLKS